MRTHSSWESRCRRCGRCCYEKIEFEGEVYYTDEPCEFLDPDSRLCSVYEQRHTQKPDCSPLTPRQLRRGLLPADCPYVISLAGYKPPLTWEPDDN